MIKLKKLILLCLLPLLASLPPAGAVTSTAQSEHAGRAPGVIRIPVFYLTDREQKGSSYGPNRKYLVGCRHDPFFGKVSCAVDNEQSIRIDSTLARQDWQEERHRFAAQPKIVDRYSADASDSGKQDKARFLEDIQKAVNNSPRHDLFVFVHGCSNTFESAATKAARLSYFTESPVVMYSWPSVGKLSYYRVDEGNIYWSADHFANLLDDLKTIKGARVILVLHSLAIRIVNWDFQSTIKNKAYQEVDLVCPDIDSETFKHMLAHFAGDSTRIRLYVSHKDRALALAQMFNGGYFRLGEGVSNIFQAFSQPVETLNSAEKLFQHPHFSIAPKQYETSAASVSNKNLEVIDYTILDRGFWGHRIPFQLLASMSATDMPGPGLALAPHSLGNGNWLTRFIRWSYDFQPPPAGSIGSCLRVTKVTR